MHICIHFCKDNSVSVTGILCSKAETWQANFGDKNRRLTKVVKALIEGAHISGQYTLATDVQSLF